MTATRDPDRLLRAWLDLMPDEAPDRAIAAVLQATETTRQVRVLPRFGPWRLRMNRISLIATAVLVIAALAGGVYLLAGGSNGPAVPTPTAAAPSPTGRALVIPAPEILWGDWRAETDGIPAIAQGPGQIQLSVDWQDGRTFWVQLSNGQTQSLHSNPIAVVGDELTLRATISDPCDAGAIGRYRWSRSADGMFLTLSLIEDACSARATTLARTWVHSLGAVNDGGPGVVFGVEPNLQLTLPTGQRYGAGGGEGSQDISTFGDAQPFRSFVVVRNPGGFGAPCATGDAKKLDIAHTTAAFVTYLKELPSATVTTSNTTVGGRPAVKLDVSIDAATTCTNGIQAFHVEKLSDTTDPWVMSPGQVQTLYIVQIDATTTFLVWYEGPAAEQTAVLVSIKFIDTLPTP